MSSISLLRRKAVLDASSLLALVNGEPGSEVVARALHVGAVIGAINLSEVIAKLSERGMPEDRARQMLALPIEVRAFDEAAAWSAGLLRPATRAFGLSLGDRACLALARELGLPVLTADRQWSKLRLGIKIKIIRP